MYMSYSNMWGDVCKKDGCGPVRHSQMYVLDSRFLIEAGHGFAAGVIWEQPAPVCHGVRANPRIRL
jgi:hypothetical protein